VPLSPHDIAAIINLPHLFNDAVDRSDAQTSTETFTGDGQLTSPLGNPKGHRALYEWFSTRTATTSGTRHCSMNEVVDGEGGRSTMRSSYVVIDTNDAPPALIISGR
jgi:hypothetical protein